MITFNIRLRLGLLVGKGGDLDLEYFNINCCGKSYKASTIVIYDSRVIPDLKIPYITTLES